MPDTGQNTMRNVESLCEDPPGAGVRRLLVPGVAVGVFIEGCCAVDGVEVTCSMISATRELFSKDEGVEF